MPACSCSVVVVSSLAKILNLTSWCSSPTSQPTTRSHPSTQGSVPARPSAPPTRPSPPPARTTTAPASSMTMMMSGSAPWLREGGRAVEEERLTRAATAPRCVHNHIRLLLFHRSLIYHLGHFCFSGLALLDLPSKRSPARSSTVAQPHPLGLPLTQYRLRQQQWLRGLFFPDDVLVPPLLCSCPWRGWWPPRSLTVAHRELLGRDRPPPPVARPASA